VFAFLCPIGSLFGSGTYPVFNLRDGLGYVKLNIELRSLYMKSLTLNFLLDQYAPCDNQNHTCTFSFKDQNNNIRNIDANTSSLKDLNFKLSLLLNDGQG